MLTKCRYHTSQVDLYLNVFFLSKVTQTLAFMQYNIMRDSNLRWLRRYKTNVLFINKKEPLSAALSCLTRIDILHIQSFYFFPTATKNKLFTTVIMITSLWSCVIFYWSYQCIHHNTHERPTNICKKPILSLRYRGCDNNWNQWRLKVAHVAPMNWQHICSLQWDIHLRVSCSVILKYFPATYHLYR